MRKERARRRLAQGIEAGLVVVHPNAGGIDVGNERHYVAVPADRDAQPVRSFGCWTQALQDMAAWLKACGVDTVAMQATGVYWIPLYDVLSAHGLRVVLANAQSTRSVPGRKSDVQECQWLMKLHGYGLLRDSFHLRESLLQVRTIWRLRAEHVQQATQAVQHMQKALTKMNVQLANVLSDISGLSGQAIIAAILAGERDPYRLADLRHEGVKASREEVARSLHGHWRGDLLFELEDAVHDFEHAQTQMRNCDRKLEALLAALPTREIGQAASKVQPKPRRKRAQGNAPTFALQSELRRIAGVDLTSIDGISLMTAQTILAEVGPDLSGFPSEQHFASWLGLTPAKDRSGARVLPSGKRKVRNRIATALRIAATTLRNSKSYLGARYRGLCRRLNSKPAAIKAMARYLAVLVFRLLTRGQAWLDQGAAWFERRNQERDLHALQTRAAAKGFRLVPA